MYENKLATEVGPKTGPEIERIGREVRRLLGEAMTRSAKNAADIADEMTKRLGRPVKRSTVYEFTRSDQPGLENRFPATWVSAFCEATGCDDLARFVVGPRLRELVEQGERVSELEFILKQMLEAAGKLKGQGGQKKGRDKLTRKP